MRDNYNWSFNALFDVKSLKKEFSEETKSLLEDYLGDAIRQQGIDGTSTSYANGYLGCFHGEITKILLCNDAKRKCLQLSESYFKEVLRLHTINYGPNYYATLNTALKLSNTLTALEGMNLDSEAN
jgi:hypothetical protein